MKQETFIPHFPGFYCTELSEMIDYTLERELTDDGKSYMDDWENINFSKIHEKLAIKWLEIFSREIGIELEYKTIISPREYNFENDRLMAYITVDQINKIREVVHTDLHNFQYNCEYYFSSCEGFYSFYEDDVEFYVDKPTNELDYNEVMVYIASFISMNYDIADIIDTIMDSSQVRESIEIVYIKK